MNLKGYYSIVQYCPDPSRMETVNIGAALFCPEIGFLRVEFGRRKTRVDQLFGKQDWELVEAQKTAIRARLAREKESFRDLADFESYVARRASALRLTAPRPMKVGNPEREMKGLLRRLVSDQSSVAGRSAAAARALRNAFREGRVLDLLRTDVEVHPPQLPKAIKAPFAFQNGRFNLIEPMQFEGQSAAAVFNRASVHAVEGQFLADYRDPRFGDLRLIVVGQFGDEQRGERAAARTVFDRYGVEMHELGDLEPLIEEIRRVAH